MSECISSLLWQAHNQYDFFFRDEGLGALTPVDIVYWLEPCVCLPKKILLWLQNEMHFTVMAGTQTIELQRTTPDGLGALTRIW